MIRGHNGDHPARVPCTYCNLPLNPESRLTYRRVQGWEHRAPANTPRKGGSDIVCREPLDEFACDACVGKLRRGLSPDQGALL